MKPAGLFLAAAVLFATCSTAFAGTISSILVFGDSLSDTGNRYFFTGKPDPPYFEGRYSNGLLWHEFLATQLAIPVATPSVRGGTNLAFAGAESGGIVSPILAPSLLTQVVEYLLLKHTVDPSELVAIWAGGNDYLFGDLVKSELPDPTTIVNNIELAVRSLALAGGKQFLIPNLPALGFSPLIRDKGQPGDVEKINASVQMFNRQLAQKLTGLESELGITIYEVNVGGLFNAVRADPTAYGLTDVTNSAYPDHVADANQHLFWDYVHPTTTVHALIGNQAYAAITGIPEPGSLTLTTLGLTALLAFRHRRWLTIRRPVR